MNTLNEISNYLTVIIITHRLTTIKDCDKLIKLKNGKIEAIGKPIEVLKFWYCMNIKLAFLILEYLKIISF